MLLSIILTIENDSEREIILKIYHEYYPLMLYEAERIIKDRGLAEDIVQDSIIKLFEKAATLKDLAAPQLAFYVRMTARNTAINYYNKQTKNPKTISLLGYDDDFTSKLADTDDLPEEKVEREETSRQVTSIINELPEKQRDMLYYKFYLGLSDKEIAAKMDTTANSVHVYISRIKKKLREKFDEWET